MHDENGADPSALRRHDPGLYARSFADVYDDWYGDLDDPDQLVDAFRSRVASGAVVLELGSGTGRLAGPLADAGFVVLALDASAVLLGQCAEGPLLIAADMAALPLSDEGVAAAFVAYNTLFNLADRDLQDRCFRDLSRVVRAGGVLAIECFVAPAGAAPMFGLTIRDHPVRAGDRLAIVTGPDPQDARLLVGSHVEIGTRTTCRPWRLAYRPPDQLDEIAGRCGFDLLGRTHGWGDVAFEADDDRHVSWYRRR